MSKRLVSVDYGPMSLTVGEGEGDAPVPTDLPEPDQDAVRIFRAAVDVGGRRNLDDEERGRLASPFELLAAGESHRWPTAAEVGGEIEQLWISHGGVGIREVRLGLSPGLLPRTSLRLYEAEGRLQVELHVACADTHRWLGFSLGALARNLGERMRRELNVRLFDEASGDREPMCLRWPEDADA